MKVLENQTIYECEHCGTRMFTKEVAKVHEEHYCWMVLMDKEKEVEDK